MTNRECYEYVAKHGIEALYNKGYADGRNETILKQCNHDQAVVEALQFFTDRLHSNVSNIGCADIHDVINETLVFVESGCWDNE